MKVWFCVRWRQLSGRTKYVIALVGTFAVLRVADHLVGKRKTVRETPLTDSVEYTYLKHQVDTKHAIIF